MSEDDENKSTLLHLGATVLLKDHSYRDYEPVMTQQDAGGHTDLLSLSSTVELHMCKSCDRCSCKVSESK